MNAPTTDKIQKAVLEAMEEAKAQCGSDRLLPFTAAEMRFVQDVVAGALARVLVEESA